MDTTKILVVDDNTYFINAAIEFLNTENDLEVVAIAHAGEEALGKIIDYNPDIILIDYIMQGWNGIETTLEIKKRPNAPKVILVTQFDDDEYRKEAIKNGADGFVPKTSFGEEIVGLIRELTT